MAEIGGRYRQPRLLGERASMRPHVLLSRMRRFRGAVLAVALVGTSLVFSVSSGPAVGQTPTTGQCTPWDVTGVWTITQGPYGPSVQFQQDGVTITGVMVLPEGQWQAAGWVSQTNPLSGSLVGDVLTFLVTAPTRTGTTSQGQYQGTVSAAGVTGGTARDLSAPNRAPVAWTGTGPHTNDPTKCAATPTTLSEQDAENALRDVLAGGDTAVIFNSLKPADVTAGILVANAFKDDYHLAEDDPAIARSLVVGIGALAAANNAAGSPLFPSIANNRMTAVLLRLAYHAATDTDPASAQQAASACSRLLALLAGQDLAASQGSP